MSRNLRGRLERLERSADLNDGLHPCFWKAVWGEYPVELLDPKSRRIIEAASEAANLPNPVDYQIEHPSLTREEVDRACGIKPRDDTYL